jgi:hypothetical protein
MRARTAEKQAEHAGEFTIGRTRFDPEGKPIVTAPPEEMSEADKARIAQGDERLALDRTQAGSLDAFRQQELALRKAEQAHKGDLTPYQQQELKLAQERLGLSREELKRKEASASGDPAEALKTQQEREDARLRRYSEMQAKGQALSDEQSLDYKDLWKQRSAPKYQLDASGNMQEVRPDVTHLTPPPGETAPTPGMTITPTLPGREQMGKAQQAYASSKTTTGTLDRLEGLLKDATPGQLLGGDTAAKLNTEAIALQSSLGELQNAGVLQPSDMARYEQALGSLTGPMAAVGALAGHQPVKAALGELRTMLDAKVKAQLPRAMNEQDASGCPRACRS